MAEENREVIIDLRINDEEAIKNIVEAQSAIRKLKEQNKELAASEKDTADEIAKNNEQIKALNREIAANSKEIQTNLKAQNAAEGSLDQLRAQLAKTTKQYDALSKTEREGAKGQEMLSHIQDTTDKLREAEFESGRFQRNVGNYPGLLGQVGGVMGKWANNIMMVTGGAKTLGGGIKNLGATVAGFGKQLISLMKIPIVALISAIVAVFIGLKKALKKNDDATTSLKKSFALLQPIITAVTKLFSILVTVISKLVEGTSKLFGAIMSLIPGYGEAADAAQKLVEAQDRLEDAEREYTVEHAKNEREIARLREEAANKDGATFEQRKKNIEDAMSIEKKDLEQHLRIAREKLRIAKEQQKQDDDWSDERKNEIAQLEVDTIQIETEYYNGMRRLQREYSNFLQEEYRREEEVKNKRAELLKKSVSDYESAAKVYTSVKFSRLAEEASLMVDGIDKALKITSNAFAQRKNEIKDAIDELNKKISEFPSTFSEYYERYREELGADWNEEMISTVRDHYQNMENEKKKYLSTISEYNKMLKLLEQSEAKELEKIYQNFGDDVFSALKADYERRIELAVSGTREEYELKLDALDLEEEAAVKAAEEKGENVTLVEAIYIKKRQQLADDYRKKELDAARAAAQMEVEVLENKMKHALADAGSNEIARLEVQKEYAEKRLNLLQQEYDNIAAMTEQDAILRFGSLDAWKSAMLAADNEIMAANEKLRESTMAVAAAQREQSSEIMSAFSNVGNAISGLFDELAEADEDYQDFATAMAMANILVSTAVSIANAIQGATAAAAATGVAAPFTTPVFIAEMVGIVAGAIASAVTTLTQAKSAASAAKYADGGFVSGPGTSRSDSIPARLSNGEFVVNAEATRRNLPQLLAINGGWGATSIGFGKYADGGWVSSADITRGLQMDQIRETMIEAVSDIQPVVSVKEITRVAHRVEVKENISKY